MLAYLAKIFFRMCCFSRKLVQFVCLKVNLQSILAFLQIASIIMTVAMENVLTDINARNDVLKFQLNVTRNYKLFFSRTNL